MHVPEKRVHITLSHKGVFYLNSNAYAMLGKPEAVALYFNKADSVIGISSARRDHASAFPVRQNNTSYVIHAKPFCQHYGIRIDPGAVVFQEPEVDSQGILHLDLKTTTDAVRRTMKPRTPEGQ